MTILDLESGDRFVFTNTNETQVFEVYNIHVKGKEPETWVKEIGGKTSDGKWFFYPGEFSKFNPCALVRKVTIQVV